MAHSISMIIKNVILQKGATNPSTICDVVRAAGCDNVMIQGTTVCTVRDGDNGPFRVVCAWYGKDDENGPAPIDFINICKNLAYKIKSTEASIALTMLDENGVAEQQTNVGVVIHQNGDVDTFDMFDLLCAASQQIDEYTSGCVDDIDEDDDCDMCDECYDYIKHARNHASSKVDYAMFGEQAQREDIDDDDDTEEDIGISADDMPDIITHAIDILRVENTTTYAELMFTLTNNFLNQIQTGQIRLVSDDDEGEE